MVIKPRPAVRATHVCLENNIGKSEIITEKNTDLLTELKENNFLFDTEVTKYLGAIFNHILEKNNLDKNEFHFFVNRSDVVNASAYEDGTVICNLGILNIMESESQVAMVFSHEIAHYLLNHVNNAILNNFGQTRAKFSFRQSVQSIQIT